MTGKDAKKTDKKVDAKKLGLVAVFIYGLGDILGAGIYAVIGPVAELAGQHLWIAFAIALVVAFLTALSYAELVARFPKSGGVAHYSQKTFNIPLLSFVSGWLLLFVSIVSMATLSTAFNKYLATFGFEIPTSVTAALFLGVLGLINFTGIQQSSWANIVATIVEVSGLGIVIYAAIHILGGDFGLPTASGEFSWIAIFKAAALAFYAFIGFEDLANIAEEVKEPKRNLPRAILMSLAAAGAIYLAIGALSTASVSPEVLAKSDGPLIEVVKKSEIPIPLSIFAIIALFAVSNTCLLNSVTASRLLMGLAEDKLAPQFFGIKHAKTDTPYVGIAAAVIAAYGLVLVGSLSVLAGATSVLILLVFIISNVCLLKAKKKEPKVETFRSPVPLVYLAILGNLALIFSAQKDSLSIVAGVLVLGVLLGKLSIAKSRA